MTRHLQQVSPPSLVNDSPVEYQTNGYEKAWHDWTVWAVANLSGSEFKLVHLLARYQGKNEWAYPSRATLQADMGLEEKQMKRLLKKLKSKKQIEEEPRPGKTTLRQVTWKIDVDNETDESGDQNTPPTRGQKCPPLYSLTGV